MHSHLFNVGTYKTEYFIQGVTVDVRTILQKVRENLPAVIAHETPQMKEIWEALLALHPADLANFLTDLDRDDFKTLFLALPKELCLAVFEELSDPLKVVALACMSSSSRIEALNSLHADQLTDLFDLFSDEELTKYLKQLHKKSREQVLSLLKFDPESAGGIMDTGVLTLREDFTVGKSVDLLRRITPSQEIFSVLYVTDNHQKLVGYIRLEDLVLKDPKARISAFTKKAELVAQADEDQEAIAKKMVHYGLMNIPVVSKDGIFLGAIPAETLADVLVEEASEDVQKMAAVTPLKYSYFDTSFFKMLYERGYILVILLLIESFSNTILRAYESTLGILLYGFVPMIISVGGNSSNQTSAVAIQGMATGEIRPANMLRFWWRELRMAFLLAIILGSAAFARVYLTSGEFWPSVAISAALTIIVLTSVSFASGMPLLLRRMGIDPAFSAGPFLATLMDILGVLIYCYVVKLILT